MNTTTWHLFYKGTALQFPYQQQSTLIALWESTIINGLRCGVSIETQKRDTKQDLDELEEWICSLSGGEEYTNEDIKKKIGEKDFKLLLNKWGLNVVCALKLKIIGNDDKNGHLFIEEK